MAGTHTHTHSPARPEVPSVTALLSPPLLSFLRQLPGNNQCCDCSSYHDIQWASVSHGVLLCLACAGKHRGLGVQVSVVKSLHMDEWDPVEVYHLLDGGNKQFIKTIGELDATLVLQATNFTIAGSVSKVYLSSPVMEYRTHLRRRAEFLFRNDGSLDNFNTTCSDNLGETSIWPWDHPGSLLPIPCSLSEANNSDSPDLLSAYTMDISFPEGPLGMTLTKDSKSGRAFVSKLVRGGAAHTSGARVHDFVEEVNSVPTQSYQTAMQTIQSATRPVTIQFSRQLLSRSDSSFSDDGFNAPEIFNPSISSSIPTLSDSLSSTHISLNDADTTTDVVSREFRAVFPAPPLGITVVSGSNFSSKYRTSLEDIECFRVVVNKVISDSQAYSQGIREGDSVVGINGEWVAEYKDFVQKVTAAAYPITLVLRRSS